MSKVLRAGVWVDDLADQAAVNAAKVDIASGIVTVNNGASTTTPRPAGASIVYWLGTAQPANAAVGDIWWSPV